MEENTTNKEQNSNLENQESKNIKEEHALDFFVDDEIYREIMLDLEDEEYVDRKNVLKMVLNITYYELYGITYPLEDFDPDQWLEENGDNYKIIPQISNQKSG